MIANERLEHGEDEVVGGGGGEVSAEQEGEREEGKRVVEDTA